ncbi:hyoscyamine 6-dioxygenase-like [Apium graveolens]|uniref:hyoscyamine 6-dioxygenase-like n=1 Tax=Apium graveolens TaxID=4045 RepID=UPI003D7B7E9A
MDILMSNWKNVESVPKSFIFPPDRRPGNNPVLISKDIPVIDLGNFSNHGVETIQQILEASQEYGIFQVINHGVSVSLMNETMNVCKDFFDMPGEYKASFYSNDPTKNCRLYTSTLNYDKEEFHYWRDNLTHRCHPLPQDHIQSWPDKPNTYRETVGAYSVQIREFLLTILDILGQGLGLEVGFFEGELTKNQLMSINYHIPCPDPSLALAMPEHCDPNLISMLQQCDVPGLEVYKDGHWTGVETIPDAIVVIPGLQLRVISNEKIKSAIHRVVTNSTESRTTIGMFVIPSNEIAIEPARELTRNIPAVYTSYVYKDFFSTFTGKGCEAETVLKCFRLVD